MSLAPVVGYREMVAEDEEGLEWFLEDLASINRVLEEAGLPRHAEPETLEAYDLRVELNHLGTSWLHHLRRLQAHALQDPAYVHVPVDDDAAPWDDAAVIDELSVYLRSHLIIHADTAGYYVPIDFADVLYGAPGGDMLGSSVRLLAELVAIAPYLGVTLDADGSLSDAEAWRVAAASSDEDGDPAYREKAAWLLLFEIARISVAQKTLIRFD